MKPLEGGGECNNVQTKSGQTAFVPSYANQWIEIGSPLDLRFARRSRNVANGICMFENDSYVVRVISLTNAADLYTWELCRADGLVIQRSSKTFPTRVEALFDSAQCAVALTLGPVPHFPQSVV
jgi:hypothetical protein